MNYHLSTIFFLASILFYGHDVLASQYIDKALQEKSFIIIVGEHRENVNTEEFQSWFKEIPSLTHGKDHASEIENVSACLPQYEPCTLRMTARDHFAITKKHIYEPDRYAITDYVEALEKRIGAPPQNATLAIVDDRVIVDKAHVNGYGIDVHDTVDAIVTALLHNDASVDLEYEKQLADIRSDNLTELGLVELIGEGRSDFTGSTLSRIHNIKTAAENFNGLLIAPGEEFSFVENLGPVDGEHGFKKELVIKDNQTKPEYGGGVCQVSTTVFRAAILTGMEITQRRNHSYPVHYYYPTGFDATVYVPAPDMRFKNNTGKYVMLDMAMEGKELIFRFYGTKDGRSVAMKGPVVTQRGTDGSMKTYFTQTVVDADGNIILDDTFYSNYKSPNAYPRAGQEVTLTSKPQDWSKKQWATYKNSH